MSRPASFRPPPRPRRRGAHRAGSAWCTRLAVRRGSGRSPTARPTRPPRSRLGRARVAGTGLTAERRQRLTLTKDTREHPDPLVPAGERCPRGRRGGRTAPVGRHQGRSPTTTTTATGPTATPPRMYRLRTGEIRTCSPTSPACAAAARRRLTARAGWRDSTSPTSSSPGQDGARTPTSTPGYGTTTRTKRLERNGTGTGFRWSSSRMRRPGPTTRGGCWPGADDRREKASWSGPAPGVAARRPPLYAGSSTATSRPTSRTGDGRGSEIDARRHHQVFNPTTQALSSSTPTASAGRRWVPELPPACYDPHRPARRTETPPATPRRSSTTPPERKTLNRWSRSGRLWSVGPDLEPIRLGRRLPASNAHALRPGCPSWTPRPGAGLRGVPLGLRRQYPTTRPPWSATWSSSPRSGRRRS